MECNWSFIVKFSKIVHTRMYMYTSKPLFKGYEWSWRDQILLKN